VTHKKLFLREKDNNNLEIIHLKNSLVKHKMEDLETSKEGYIVKLSRVVKYFGNVTALKEINMNVRKGTIHGIIGPNGAGKTTLLRIIAGIIFPTVGHVSVFGKTHSSDSVYIKSRIGYLPEIVSLYSDLTPIEFFKFIKAVFKIPKEKYEHRLAEYLELFEFDTRFLNDYMANLSKGMLQRVAIISILLHDPQLFLLDEPFYGLDPRGMWTLKKILRDRVMEGATVIVASHILPLIEDFCEYVTILKEGRAILEGTIEEIKSETGIKKSLEELFIRKFQGV